MDSRDAMSARPSPVPLPTMQEQDSLAALHAEERFDGGAIEEGRSILSLQLF
jgi:hypothetical protein